MLNTILRFIERFIPRKLYRAGQPAYHWLLALVGAIVYGFPSRHIHVVGVTGTKGKSTTVELVNAVLEAAGKKTALMGTIRFKIADDTRPNLYKMSVPGRFFVQRFLRQAVAAGCDWAVLEMTSEGAKQFRHKWIDLDALIFTNLAPEHIESHGSYEKYRDAKLSIARELARSQKPNTAIIANIDDPEGSRFLACGAKRQFPYSLADAKPYRLLERGSVFTFDGTSVSLHVDGEFNIQNAVAAATFAKSQSVDPRAIVKGLAAVDMVRGRVEHIRLGQPFDVVVDYAHTPDSLKSFYSAFDRTENICILGNTGGGRDAWKRPEMARIAEDHAVNVILTNEDPYDEDPQKILDEMAQGVVDKSKLSIILDRREAIRTALTRALDMSQGNTAPRVAVLITGKGTDPYIMGPQGTKLPWDDATVVREELALLGYR